MSLDRRKWLPFPNPAIPADSRKRNGIVSAGYKPILSRAELSLMNRILFNLFLDSVLTYMYSKIPNSATWNELGDRANVYFPSEHKYKTRQFQTGFSPYSYFNFKKKGHGQY